MNTPLFRTCTAIAQILTALPLSPRTAKQFDHIAGTVLGPLLRRADERGYLDFSLRVLGAPPARWYEPRVLLRWRVDQAAHGTVTRAGLR